jgi:hypothetical protein
MIYHLSESEGYRLLTIIKTLDNPYLSRILALKSVPVLGGIAAFFYKT